MKLSTNDRFQLIWDKKKKKKNITYQIVQNFQDKDRIFLFLHLYIVK